MKPAAAAAVTEVVREATKRPASRSSVDVLAEFVSRVLKQRPSLNHVLDSRLLIFACESAIHSEN